MHVNEIIEDLVSQGIPIKEAARQARAVLRKQEDIRKANNAEYSAALRQRRPPVPAT